MSVNIRQCPSMSVSVLTQSQIMDIADMASPSILWWTILVHHGQAESAT